MSLDTHISETGRLAFTLVLSNPRLETQTMVRRSVRNIIGLWLTAVHQDDEGLEIDGEWSGDDGSAGLLRSLAAAGLAGR